MQLSVALVAKEGRREVWKGTRAIYLARRARGWSGRREAS
jgi:hypothetical protein